jgi:hypothetical protein
MSTNAWTIRSVAVVLTAALTAPGWTQAAGPLQPIPADAFPSEASFDTASLADQACRGEYREADGEWYDTCQRDIWRVTADAFFLQRNDPGAAVLVVNAIDDTEILNAGDFDFGVQAGADVSLTRRLGDRFGMEVRYFGIDSWRAQAASLTTPGSLLQVNSLPPLFPAAGTRVEAQQSSDLQDVEVNGHYRIQEEWTLLAGFRYAELDENFAADWIDAAVPFHYETTTRNRLYGCQLGTVVTLWDGGGPLSIECVVKSGIFGNHAAQDSANSTTQPASDSASETAFIGELGLTGNYRLTDHLSFRGGYRLLWIDRVALAADQVPASNFLFSNGIDATGDAFYHGAFVGLQYVR